MMDLFALPGLDPGLSLYIEGGGALVAPNIADITGNITILAGSAVDLPGATNVADMTMNVNGALSLPALTSLSNSTITVAESGLISVPELLAISGTNVTVNGNGVFDAPKLAAMTGTVNATRYISVTIDGQFDAPDRLHSCRTYGCSPPAALPSYCPP